MTGPFEVDHVRVSCGKGKQIEHHTFLLMNGMKVAQFVDVEVADRAAHLLNIYGMIPHTHRVNGG